MRVEAYTNRRRLMAAKGLRGNANCSKASELVGNKRTRLSRKLQDPMQSDLGIKPLSGREGFRLRVGGWRALYQIERNRLIICVIDIGPRGGIYK
ncbi:type II toxin-antitoxin system RelE family toxin [Nitrosococcus oceani]|uniref:type II toxin-antitoxin system RelE family toxin n=1 Tax=Nitrosococcus oceani TaxID=1229 RepID=UPI0005689950